MGGVIGGRHKIYVAFTVERVVKCNYRGGLTHRRATAQQADWQEGTETSDQGLFIHTVSSFVPSSFFLYPSVSHQLQTHKSERCNKSKLQCQNS